ncbi:MAG TPA: carboxymuconolactone decarboxylase family protein [Burkholderiales bacterium]|jgi:AhpD family alkylhydroperoxidase|nr:carboxymuconolactone decarboxylase family protein [Burkholderiales bacterium]
MARVPYVDDAGNPQLKPIADRIRAERGGRLLNLYRALLNNPQLADAWRQLFTVIRQQCELPSRERELVIMAIAVMNGADYEYSHHAPIALAAGLTQAQLDALPRWRDATVFDARDCAVLAYAEAMTREVHVAEAVFQAVAHWFGPRQMVELTATIGGYNLVSRVLEALQVDHE